MERVSSWNDVDLALREIGECDIAIAGVEGEVTISCNEIREAAKPKIAPYAAKKEHLEKLVTLYCEGNKHEFIDKRSKQFNFGEIGFRLVKSVSLPRVKEKIASLIKALKKAGFGDCVETTEAINKEAVSELQDGDLAKIGLKRVVRDSFRITPKLEAIEPAGGER
ncbi:MAG: host-nuclease inhibitor Gam family protein [Helicobacteraceae bacterium]|jgi:phage host-nuclease inhibitor protein Gam|nr:host-nuclease inhibitor Gam family protein [Helicobacteraceae bacterium]